MATPAPFRFLNRRTSPPSRFWGYRPIGLAVYTLLLSLLPKHLSMHLVVMHLSAITSTVVLVSFEMLSRLQNRPEINAKLYVRRSWVISVLVLLNLTTAGSLTAAYRPWRDSSFSRDVVLGLFALGVLAGAIVRFYLDAYVDSALIHKSVQRDDTALILLPVALCLSFFTVMEPPVFLEASCLIGVSVGFALPSLQEWVTRIPPEEERMRRKLAEMLIGPDGPRCEEREFLALGYYLDQDFSGLQKLLDRQTRMTALLVAVQASMLRALGQYEKALQILNQKLRECHPEDDFLCCLYLLKALCHWDLDSDTTEISAALKAAVALSPGCPLIKCLRAFLRAEGIPWDVQDSRSKRNLLWAYAQVRQVLLSVNNEKPNLESRLVGTNVPFTKLYLLGAQGYFALRCGRKEESRSLLEYCLRAEPNSGAAHLYFAELHLLSASESSGDDESLKRHAQAARLHLFIARELEGRKNGFIKRRVQMLLSKYFSK